MCLLDSVADLGRELALGPGSTDEPEWDRARGVPIPAAAALLCDLRQDLHASESQCHPQSLLVAVVQSR